MFFIFEVFITWRAFYHLRKHNKIFARYKKMFHAKKNRFKEKSV